MNSLFGYEIGKGNERRKPTNGCSIFMNVNDYERKVYIIPLNFAIEGKAIRGIPLRNILEAAVIFVFFLIPDVLLMPSFTAKIYGGVVCAVPAAVALIGINGLSLTSFFSDILRYRGCNTVYAKPTPEAILVRERQIIREKHKILQEKEKQQKKQEKEELALAKASKKQVLKEAKQKRRPKKQTDVFG